MKLLVLIIVYLASSHLLGQETNQVKIIELHNKTIDQLVSDSNNNKLNLESLISSDNVLINTTGNSDENIIEDDLQVDQLDSENNVLVRSMNNDLKIWSDVSKSDSLFLLNNINEIKSALLKNELIDIFDIKYEPMQSFKKENFDKLIIDNLQKLGERKKIYSMIQNLNSVKNKEYDVYYKKFNLNYLFSTFKLTEACNYSKEIENTNTTNENNFFLKVDIFCLILEEKFDEAGLLNSLLEDPSTAINKDEYFQYLFNNLQNISTIENVEDLNMNEENIYLYGAMHRIGNIPLLDKFLEIDPINLSMPILLNSSTNINLRLKAANIAYSNNLLPIDSLSALYQTVDFSFEELNETSKTLPNFDKNVQLGMAYFYQLINIQILSITRLEAIIKFWNFAEKYNLENIAYKLSLKNLDTIEPSAKLSSYGNRIAKAYIYSDEFEKAEKWIIFFESAINEENFLYKLNTIKLLYNLFINRESQDFVKILLDNLLIMNAQLDDSNDLIDFKKNEILNQIFFILSADSSVVFKVENKIFDERLMPSIYILNLINKSSFNQNNPELLISILASIDGKNWNEIHPQHLRLILNSLKKYKEGNFFNNIVLEVLMQSNII